MSVFPPSGGLPNSSASASRYVHPNGSDSNAGTSWFSPLKYFKTAWTQLQSLGGGTIFFADGTHISADGRGLHIAGADGGVYPEHSVPPMPAQVIGLCVNTGGSLFLQSPPALLSGGAQNPSTDQDDPGIWLSNATGYPISFSNVRLTDELNKPIRIGWDYYRDGSGVIAKQNVTHADRANEQTVFTCDPFEFDIYKISRTSNVVSVILGLRTGQACPIRRGMTAFVDYTLATKFSPGAFVVTNDGQFSDGGRAGFSFASVGDDFSSGSTSGPSIGTASCNLAAPNDWITVYGGVTEFPESTYLVLDSDDTTITVRDVYGYSPRHATASADDIGTYAGQDRQDYVVAKDSWDNIASRMVGDLEDDRFVNGPGLDSGPNEFFQMNNMSVFGCNTHKNGSDYGTRDPDRRAAILFNSGNSSQGVGFGTVSQAPIGYGGIRYWCGVNASAIMSFAHICCDQPVGNFKSVPAVEVLQGNQYHAIYIEDASLVDADPDIAAVQVDANSPFSCVRVNSVFGPIFGPCTVMGGPYPGIQWGASSTPNSLSQTGHWGHDRLIAGRHPGTYRNGDIASGPLASIGISNDPDDWASIDGGITVTNNVRDPFGGTLANRFSSATSGPQILIHSGGYATVANVGDVCAAAVWMRTNGSNVAYTIDVRYNVDNTILFTRSGYFSTANGNEWVCVATGGRLEQVAGILPTGNISCVLQVTMSAGQTIDIYEPSIYRLTQADESAIFSSVSDTELAEILTNIKTVPSYLSAGITGTHFGQKFVAHGGLGTNAKYIVGGGSGQITIGSQNDNAIEVFDATGASLGVIKLFDFTVN